MKNDQRAFFIVRNLRDDPHADSDILRGDAFHATHQPHTLLQIDQCDVVRLLGWPGINDGNRLNDPSSGRLGPFRRWFAIRPDTRRKIAFAGSRIAGKGYPAFLQRIHELAFGRNPINVMHYSGIWSRAAFVNWR